jgi:tetratricopeptide (TPR) repeat protein
MKTPFIVATLLSVFFNSLSQELIEAEKRNIEANIRSISVDSALTTALLLLGRGSFYELSSGEERIKEMRSVHMALEILRLIEPKCLGNDDYYDLRATGFKLLRNYEQAIIYYSKAIAINTKNVRYFKMRAECKMAIHNNYGAIPDLTKALEFMPNDDELYARRASCHLATEQWNNCLIDSNKAISLNSKQGFYYLTRSAVHMYFKRKKEACLDLSTAADLGEEEAFELLSEYCSD